MARVICLLFGLTTRPNRPSSPKGAQHSNLPRIQRTPTAVAVVGKARQSPRTTCFAGARLPARRAIPVPPSAIYTFLDIILTEPSSALRRKEDLMPRRLATCVCGQLTVSCSGDPAQVSLCHCLACQRRTGSTYGIAAFFPRENVGVAGESKAYTRSSDSGYPVSFYFCPDCGSTVYWKPDRKPEMGGRRRRRPSPIRRSRPPSQAVYAEHRHRWVPNGPAS
jgi:hypothetical protein